MNENEWCGRCENFTFKILLNGFHGICKKHKRYAMFDESCEDFTEKQHKEAGDKQTDKQTSWKDEPITKGTAFKAVEDKMESLLKRFGYDSYEEADEKIRLVYDGMMDALTAIYDMPPSAQPETHDKRTETRACAEYDKGEPYKQPDKRTAEELSNDIRRMATGAGVSIEQTAIYTSSQR